MSASSTVYTFTLVMDSRRFEDGAIQAESVHNGSREILSLDFRRGGERRAMVLLRELEGLLRRHVNPSHPVMVVARRAGKKYIERHCKVVYDSKDYFPSVGDVIELRWPTSSRVWRKIPVTKIGKRFDGKRIFWPEGWEDCGPLMAHHQGEIWRKPVED